MRSRYLLSIMLLLPCHPQMQSQVLTKALPGDSESTGKRQPQAEAEQQNAPAVPDDPSQELLPIAKPEPLPQSGTPVRWEALEQTQAGDVWTLSGEVVLDYKIT